MNAFAALRKQNAAIAALMAIFMTLLFSCTVKIESPPQGQQTGAITASPRSFIMSPIPKPKQICKEEFAYQVPMANIPEIKQESQSVPAAPPPAQASQSSANAAREAPSPAPSPGPVEDVDKALSALHAANVAFNLPETMNLNNTAEIQLLLSLKRSIEELSGEITAQGKKEGDAIKASHRMRARLTGPNFQIAEITPMEQAVGTSDTVEWKWEIKPLSAGRHNLHLSLDAMLSFEGSSTPHNIRTFDKTIEVEITAAQNASAFLGKNWQWLLAVILLPFGKFVWNRWKKRNEISKTPNA